MSDNRDKVYGVQQKAIKPSLLSPVLPSVSNEQYIIELLSRIENNTRYIAESHKPRTNIHVHYYRDTSDTSRVKIDIVKDNRIPMSELIVLDNGGGFDIEINDEKYRITSSLGFQIVDETIKHVYITGSGTSGTARIRFGGYR